MSQESANHLLDHTAQSIDHATARVSDMASGSAQRGVAALREGSQHVLDRAQQASDATAGYVRQQPFQSLLIAAAAGALLTMLAGMMMRPRGDRS
jgi:ElaB/YqjD/DUF883 family membrane-anchored ribosome-binding protein